jgi:hypothetical protein
VYSLFFILHIILSYSVQIIFTVYTTQALKFKYPPNRIVAKTKVQEKVFIALVSGIARSKACYSIECGTYHIKIRVLE